MSKVIYDNGVTTATVEGKDIHIEREGELVAIMPNREGVPIRRYLPQGWDETSALWQAIYNYLPR